MRSLPKVEHKTRKVRTTSFVTFQSVSHLQEVDICISGAEAWQSTILCQFPASGAVWTPVTMTRGAVITATTGQTPLTLTTRTATCSAPGCVRLRTCCMMRGPLSGELGAGQDSQLDVSVIITQLFGLKCIVNQILFFLFTKLGWGGVQGQVEGSG